MKPNQIISYLIFFLFCPFVLFAQENTDFLRSTGKIYTVVAVIAIFFVFIIVFLFGLDRKIKNLEKQIPNE